MAEDLHTVEGPRVTTLVNGIVHDAQELLHQQIALFKHEVRENLRKTKEAAQSLSLGAGLGMTGGLFLGFMLVYVLHEVWPRLALWAPACGPSRSATATVKRSSPACTGRSRLSPAR